MPRHSQVDDRTLELPFDKAAARARKEQLERERDENRRDMQRYHARPSSAEIATWKRRSRR